MQAQKGQLSAQRAAQNELLIQTKGEEAKYQELKNSANKEKKKLEAEQQRLLDEMARQNNASKPVYSGGGGSSGYPFAGSCPGSKDRFIVEGDATLRALLLEKRVSDDVFSNNKWNIRSEICLDSGVREKSLVRFALIRRSL